MRELAAALAKKCKRTKPKTEKENKVSEAEADSLNLLQFHTQTGSRSELELGALKSAKNQNR